MIRPPPSSPLFPYTPLFRSVLAPPGVADPNAGGIDPPAELTRGRTGNPNGVEPAGQAQPVVPAGVGGDGREDRKSTRLNSSHLVISYAVFCLKKKNLYHVIIRHSRCIFFFLNDPAPPEFSPLPLHAALPFCSGAPRRRGPERWGDRPARRAHQGAHRQPERCRARGAGAAGSARGRRWRRSRRSEEHTSELQSPCNLVCRLLLEKKKSVPRHNTPLTLHLFFFK